MLCFIKYIPECIYRFHFTSAVNRLVRLVRWTVEGGVDVEGGFVKRF